MKLRKYAAQVEYLGTAYAGWQRQSHADTVQGRVEQALSKVANNAVDAFCSGRTDTGVHATGQIIHFETSVERAEKNWLLGGNAQLPNDIRLIWVKEVSQDFHARFSALSRTYRYVIYNREIQTPVLQNRVTWVRRKLNIQAMNDGAQYLLGEQDFSSFRAVHCQSNTAMRNIMQAEVYEKGSFIVFEIKGNAFLYHMVRNIVGTLLDIGLGLKQPEWVKDLLSYKDRTLASPTAAPDGLYLVNIEYPNQFILPQSKIGPDFIF